MGAKSSSPPSPPQESSAIATIQDTTEDADATETAAPRVAKSAEWWRDTLLHIIANKSTELDLNELAIGDVDNIPWELLPQCTSVTHLTIDYFPLRQPKERQYGATTPPHFNRDDVETLFPSQVYEMTNLQSLSMNYYPFEYISPKLGNLVNLTELKFLGSNVICLPPEIGKLTKLTKLDHYCSYSIAFAPYELTNCPITKTYISRRPNYIYNSELLPPLPKPLNMNETKAQITALWTQKCGMIEGLVAVILDYLPSQACSNPLCKNKIVWKECIHYAWSVYTPGVDPVCLLATMCSNECVQSIGYGNIYYLALTNKQRLAKYKKDLADETIMKKKNGIQTVYVNANLVAANKWEVCKSLSWSSRIKVVHDLREELERFEYFWKYKLGINYSSFEMVEKGQNPVMVTFAA